MKWGRMGLSSYHGGERKDGKLRGMGSVGEIDWGEVGVREEMGIQMGEIGLSRYHGE